MSRIVLRQPIYPSEHEQISPGTGVSLHRIGWNKTPGLPCPGLEGPFCRSALSRVTPCSPFEREVLIAIARYGFNAFLPQDLAQLVSGSAPERAESRIGALLRSYSDNGLLLVAPGGYRIPPLSNDEAYAVRTAPVVRVSMEAEEEEAPPKRGRGRPKGSKTKNRKVKTKRERLLEEMQAKAEPSLTTEEKAKALLKSQNAPLIQISFI